MSGPVGRALDVRLLAIDRGDAGAREAFQEVIRRLVKLTYPSARNLDDRSGDWGIDTFHGDLDGGAIVVWQAKYFLNGVGPASVEYEYVKVLLLCRIGNGHGISEAGRPDYDELINRWSERHVIAMIRLLADDREVESRLQFQMCRTNLKQLAGRACGSNLELIRPASVGRSHRLVRRAAPAAPYPNGIQAGCPGDAAAVKPLPQV